MQKMQPAAGVARVDEDRLAAVDQRRQRLRVVLVRDRRHHQHDQVGAADRLGDVGGDEIDRHQALRDAARLDAALRPQRREPLVAAGMQPHRVAALAEVGRRREAAVSSAQNRNRFHRH